MLNLIARLGLIAAVLWLALIAASVAAGRVLPDGGKIVFDSSWNGNRERIIYMVDVDTGTFHNLTMHQHIDGMPVLSPDGSQMAFVSVQEDMGRIYITDLNSIRRLENTNGDRNITWSLDGRHIAYDRNGGLFVVDVESGAVRELTSWEYGNWYPVWSSDGSRIAFTSFRDTGDWQIYTIEPDGSNLRRLTYTEEACTHPAWSPDGRHIAFELRSNIYVMDGDGSHLRPLTHSDDGNFGSWGPVWSPDGSAILFTGQYGHYSHERHLYTVNVASGAIRRLTDYPALNQDGRWSPDGTHVVFNSDHDSIYWGIYILKVEDGNVRRLVDGNIGVAGWWP